MALEDVIVTLASSPLFEQFERDALRLVAFSAETRRLRRSEILFRRGDRSDGGYVVADGEILVFRDDPADAEKATRGSLIGRPALFLRLQRPSSAVASEPSSVLRISPTLMRRIMEEFPADAAKIREAVAAELVDLTDGLELVRQKLLAVDAGRHA